MGDFFIGSEKHGRFESIGTAVIGAAAGNGIIKDMLSVYENLDIIHKNRIQDLTHIKVRLMHILKKYEKNVTVQSLHLLVSIFMKTRSLVVTPYADLDEKVLMQASLQHTFSFNPAHG